MDFRWDDHFSFTVTVSFTVTQQLSSTGKSNWYISISQWSPLKIRQSPSFSPPITLRKNTAPRWTSCPIVRGDSQIQCLIPLGSSSISASGQYCSLSLVLCLSPLIHLPSPLSPTTLHHHMSPLSRTYLSLRTSTKPVVTDKALLTKCEMMEECASASSRVSVCWSGQGGGQSSHPNSMIPIFPINMAPRVRHATVDTHTCQDHVKTPLLHGNRIPWQPVVYIYIFIYFFPWGGLGERGRQMKSGRWEGAKHRHLGGNLGNKK